MKSALAVATLLLAAACGGGDDDAGDGGLSKAEYLTKAEAVCAKANADLKKEPRPTTPAEFPAFIDKLIGLAERVQGDLGALEEPEADADELKTRLFDPLDQQIEEGKGFRKEVADALASNDSKKLGELVVAGPTKTKADLAWMRSYGFKACVEVAKTE